MLNKGTCVHILPDASVEHDGCVTGHRLEIRHLSLRKRLLLGIFGIGRQFGTIAPLGVPAAILALSAPAHAIAMNLYTGSAGNSPIEINLDTTVQYSNIFRVHSPSATLTSNPNFNDGDLDFQHGLVSNQFEILPVFDIKYGDYGVHVSGEAYLNTSYLQKSQNDSPGTYNPYTTANSRDFTSATRNVNGEDAILLDANVYGSQHFGADQNQTLTVKVGRQTLLWGQSLFFAGNGIAAGQAPIDILQAQSTPNAQTQQIVLPVGQVVVTYQPNQIFTLQAYYQFEWEADRFPGVGSYFSGADFFDVGGQRVILGNIFGTGVYAYRVKDLRPPIDNGQFGASLQATLGNYDLGIYALRYDSKSPVVFSGAPQPTSGPGINAASYYLAYPRDIQIYGASLGTTIGPVNVAGEFSGRRNMPLVELAPVPSASYPGTANAGAPFAKGSTVAAQISAVYVSPPLPFDPGGLTFLGEVAANHVVSDTNKLQLTAGRSNSAAAVQFVVIPNYFPTQLPNVELQFPVGLEAGLYGRSQVDQTMNHGDGSFNVGVTATYRVSWTAGLTYVSYFGAPQSLYNGLVDRGYVSFNIEHTF